MCFLRNPFFSSEENATKTISSLIKIASKKIDRIDAELLLAHILKKNREFILTYPEHKISWYKKQKYCYLVQQRKKNIPLAYLNNHKEFFGFDFFVNKNTLVPRPDTEILIEAALFVIQNTDKEFSLIDIGTGSGCIPISIYKTLKNTVSKKLDTFQIFASDISTQALRVAKKNAHKHNAPIFFFQGNLLEPFFKKNIFTKNKNIILTANLPYLTQEQFQSESSIQHEPLSALVANDQGLALYKELLEQIQQLLQKNTFSLTCFFEIDPSQKEILSEHIQHTFPNSHVNTIKDLAGFHRVIQIQF